MLLHILTVILLFAAVVLAIYSEPADSRRMPRSIPFWLCATSGVIMLIFS